MGDVLYRSQWIDVLSFSFVIFFSRVKNGEQNLEDLANDTTSDIDVSGDTSHVFTVTAKDIQG